MSNYEMPKCPMGHEMELLQVASGGWRYGCAKCATSYKVQKRAHYGWLSPIKSTKERAYEAAVKRPMQKPLTVDELKETYFMREDHVWPHERKPPYLYLDSSIEKNDNLWVAWSIVVDFLETGYRQYTVESYGKTWRCWASRPTEEERKAAEWEK